MRKKEGCCFCCDYNRGIEGRWYGQKKKKGLLGLLGLFCVQILKANGCRVLGLDFNEDRLALAKQFGAETIDLSSEQDAISISKEFSRGRGVEGLVRSYLMIIPRQL